MRFILPLVFLLTALPAGAQSIPPGAIVPSPEPTASTSAPPASLRPAGSGLYVPERSTLQVEGRSQEFFAKPRPTCGEAGAADVEEFSGRSGGVNSSVTDVFLRVRCRDGSAYVLKRHAWREVNGVWSEIKR